MIRSIPRKPGAPKCLTFAGVWAGPADQGERAVQPLRQLAEPLLDFSGQMPYCDVQRMFDGLFPKDVHRAYFKSVYLNGLNDATIDEIAQRATDRPTDLTLCSVWYMGGAVGRVAADATAFGDRGMGWMLSIDAIWQDPADDARTLAWARAFWADMKHQFERPRLSQLRRAGRGRRGTRARQLWRRQLRTPGRIEKQVRSDQFIPSQPKHQAVSLTALQCT